MDKQMCIFINVLLGSLIISLGLITSTYIYDKGITGRVNLRENLDFKKEARFKECLKNADNNSYDFWNKNCKTKGLEEDCLLDDYTMNRVEDVKGDMKRDCYEIYR